ncbi:MAG: D-alanyl-D-alanine carboxypeptidase/D-alanyl-D-alanine-endopeptidase [Ferruginibacter sp.]
MIFRTARLLSVFITFIPLQLPAQVKEALSVAVNVLENDPQFNHASISLYVVNANTGKVVFQKNSKLGVAPASCQKIITSASAFELLGSNYQYKTVFKLDKAIDTTVLLIDGTGDPTIGSWRWETTTMDAVLQKLRAALASNKLSAVRVVLSNNKFPHQPVPDGWVWEDIGNYYGAGAWAFNWHENQYDLLLASGKAEGDSTHIIGFDPSSAEMPLSNFITTGKKGSGDNAYIYAAPYSNTGFATGTIPPGQERFKISGSIPEPSSVFIKALSKVLGQNGVAVVDKDQHTTISLNTSSFKTICTITSPTFDSMNYWFLKKSINLYGEAFVKTIGSERGSIASTDTGISIIRDFWEKKGIERSAINIIDGSGLSPANRITTNALVKVLQFAKQQPWFSSFQNALPEINGIKMKDGYIGGVRSYAGYVTSLKGEQFIFSFIINNYDGDPGIVRQKMWRILDILK